MKSIAKISLGLEANKCSLLAINEQHSVNVAYLQSMDDIDSDVATLKSCFCSWDKGDFLSLQKPQIFPITGPACCTRPTSVAEWPGEATIIDWATPTTHCTDTETAIPGCKLSNGSSGGFCLDKAQHSYYFFLIDTQVQSQKQQAVHSKIKGSVQSA